MITEIKNQLDVKPDAIFCSVGGGGLLGGIIVGCKNENWDDGERKKLSFLASLNVFAISTYNWFGNNRLGLLSSLSFSQPDTMQCRREKVAPWGRCYL